jgi:hypothetical protein
MKIERQNDAAYQEMLTSFPPEVRELATAVRALILDVMPQAFEVVWARQRTAGYGTGPKKMSEHFCWIAPQRDYVDIGFNYGSELPDPARLLEGTGRLFRHVKVRSLDDVKNPALREMVQTASGHRVPPLPDHRTPQP